MAYEALSHLLGFDKGSTGQGDGYASTKPALRGEYPPGGGGDDDESGIPTRVLPRQVSYGGSHPAQESAYGSLPPRVAQKIPGSLLRAFSLEVGPSSGRTASSRLGRRLYRHQAEAVAAAVDGTHCIVCTGTGSGKSLCFWLPVLAAAYRSDRVAFVVFPTKALAQDQLTQLRNRLEGHPDLMDRIRPATLDGDTLHSERTRVANSANVILTNPDTLHAALLPNWRSTYRSLWARLDAVVLDECHVYEGAFGAHVKMI
jgi:DEAD/DEAH box helicase domain-containing protein